MQLLNSKILSNDKNTRYSNKKAQDTRVTCAFLSVVAFSYNKDGRGDETRTHDLLVPNQARYQTALHLENALTDTGATRFYDKKRTRVSLIGFNTIQHFLKKSKRFYLFFSI